MHVHVLLCPGTVLGICTVLHWCCQPHLHGVHLYMRQTIPLSNTAAAFSVQPSSLQFPAFLHCHGLRKEW